MIREISQDSRQSKPGKPKTMDSEAVLKVLSQIRRVILKKH